ncbi:hypothetical protein OLX02_14985 [Novosphingobium sp. KCTC 2891]|uniref:hypothetical protein n=1 Tax=Novosphingobium sp. KCTC 2891 TaxID=2989730 RepID=UPI0022227045|nr:hypothetical protein [Novosphingobium sp. KCTC 2891]MCW1384126.1 hypothetical protein [Novosphingobium sp. KCTC 2891]
MACCAFAFFLLMRLLAPFRALARSLGLRGQERMDTAVAWRPGQTARAPSPAPRSGGWRRRLLAAEAAILTLIAGPAVASDRPALSDPADDPAIATLIHANICRPLGWRN